MSAHIRPLAGLHRLVFLINSRLKSLTAARLASGETCPEVTSSCFAEFLNEGSPVRLGLLALSTCVGFKYGRNIILNLEVFPGTLLISVRSRERELPVVSWVCALRICQKSALNTPTPIQ